MTGSEPLWADLERAIYEAMGMNLKLPWRPQEVRVGRNMEVCCGKLRAVTRDRGHVGCNRQS